MADPHVITALVQRRAELTGQIEEPRSLAQDGLDLENLDAIQQLDPSYRVEAIPRKAFRRSRTGATRARGPGLYCPSCGRLRSL
jgi:hypothetical protein